MPFDSATVIVLREPRPGVCEVLLLERHAESRAFAGAHVFPGGRVDPDDRADLFATVSPGLSPEAAVQRLGETLPPTAALAFWIAAIRELFEEAGVLLAARGGTPLDFHDTACRDHFGTRRAALLAGSLSFTELIRCENLTLTTDELVYFSRWITPTNAPRRFDARFFVTRLPAGQEPLHDQRETISSIWHTPADALAGGEQGRLTLAPPTVRTLEDLRELGTVERILAATRSRPFPPILPKVVAVAGRMTILYPGDAAYTAVGAHSTLANDPPGGRNRVVLDGGRWHGRRDDP